MLRIARIPMIKIHRDPLLKGFFTITVPGSLAGAPLGFRLQDNRRSLLNYPFFPVVTGSAWMKGNGHPVKGGCQSDILSFGMGLGHNIGS